jgi:hypothetical protein
MCPMCLCVSKKTTYLLFIPNPFPSKNQPQVSNFPQGFPPLAHAPYFSKSRAYHLGDLFFMRKTLYSQVNENHKETICESITSQKIDLF